MRKMKTIGEQTGIKELDDVRQIGISLYNLNDVIKVLNIKKRLLRDIINKYNVSKHEDGCWYIEMKFLKMLLVEYQDEITWNYKWHMVCNDNKLQEYGIVIDDRFAEDNREQNIMEEYAKIKQQGVDLDGCIGNNSQSIYNNQPIWDGLLTDNDLDLIYKTIDEK